MIGAGGTSWSAKCRHQAQNGRRLGSKPWCQAPACINALHGTGTLKGLSLLSADIEKEKVAPDSRSCVLPHGAIYYIWWFEKPRAGRHMCVCAHALCVCA